MVVAAVVERCGGANDTRLQDESYRSFTHRLQRKPIHVYLIFDNSWAGARSGGEVEEPRYGTPKC